MIQTGDPEVHGGCGHRNSARVVIQYAVTGSGWSVDSDAPNGVNNDTDLIGSFRDIIVTGPTTGANYEAGSFAAYGDQLENGERDVLTGEVAAGTNVSGHDCVFSLSALG